MYELKTETRFVESLDCMVDFVEMSFAGQVEVMDAFQEGRGLWQAAIIVKHCVLSEQDKSAEEIAKTYPPKVIEELAAISAEVSGIEPDDDEDLEKNSESTLSAVSHSA